MAKLISKKLGLTNNIEQLKIEKDLMKRIPKDKWEIINHTIVEHGKKICIARKPKCTECPLTEVCREYKKTHQS